MHNSGSYGNNIDACINTYLIDSTNHESFTKKEKIRIEKIEPELDQNDLNELCYQITSLKRNKTEQSTFEEKLLHDANCLNYIKCEEKGFLAQKLFITCDFSLARIRKISDYGNSIITINELYDFLLPYLLITEENFSNPNRLPNMLLETAIDLELGDSINLEQIVGEYLMHKTGNTRYKTLNNAMLASKFEQIEKRNRIIKESDLLEDECTIRINENLNEFETTYINAVKVDTIECLKKSKYEEMGKKLLESERTISEKDAKIADLTAKVEKLESKEKRRGKYEKRVKNHISKPKKKNKKKRR